MVVCLLFLFLGLLGIRTSSFETSVWQEVASLNEGRVLSSVVLFNNSVYIVGGCRDPLCANKSSSITLFDPVTNTVHELGSLGIELAGIRSAVVIDEEPHRGVYICHMCSMYLGEEEFNTTRRGMISKFDPLTGELEENFFQDDGIARGNASCVAHGHSIYIIGGLKPTHTETGSNVLVPTNQIWKFDLFVSVSKNSMGFYTDHPLPITNPAVASDSSGFYVSGGLDVDGKLSRMTRAYYPGCTRYLAQAGQDGVPQEITDPDFDLIMWAQHLIYISVSRNLVVSRPFGKKYVNERWEIYNIASHASANQSHSAALQGRLSSLMAVPMIDPEGVNSTSASLVLFQFGGIERKEESDGSLSFSDSDATGSTSPPVVVTAAVQNVISKSVSDLRIPGPIVDNLIVKEKTYFYMNLSTDVTTVCKKFGGCKVALSLSRGCGTRHACDTTSQHYTNGSEITWFPLQAAETVYLCFSFGDLDQSCIAGEGGQSEHKPIDQVYYATNVLRPFSVLPHDTVAPGPSSLEPTQAPATMSPKVQETTNMIVYVLASIAGVTTLLAICLVARLRRVPDEGILTSAPLVTQHEDRYKTVAKIGEGAFSAVYLVIRRKDGKRFAMKHMECQSDAARQDAIKECEIMRTLQGHPNVISLVDMFMNYEFDAAAGSESAQPDSNQPLLQNSRSTTNKRSRHLCLVMEYHASGDLKRWLSQFAGHPSEAILCSIAFQVVSVLVHIHNQEPPVIHRDLKPENLLINQNAASSATFIPIVVTDFGLARLQEESHCKQGAGTLPYVAPECFRKNYTTQCDMWSLGCVLYALATKRVSHDRVRLMFEDCRLKNFETLIKSDLQSLGYHAEFTNFLLMLLQVDPNKRLTAAGAFKLFRKRGELIYLTSRIAQLPGQKAKTLTQPQARNAPIPKTTTITTQPVPIVSEDPDRTFLQQQTAALPDSSCPHETKLQAMVEEPRPVVRGEEGRSPSVTTDSAVVHVSPEDTESSPERENVGRLSEGQQDDDADHMSTAS